MLKDDSYRFPNARLPLKKRVDWIKDEMLMNEGSYYILPGENVVEFGFLKDEGLLPMGPFESEKDAEDWYLSWGGGSAVCDGYELAYCIFQFKGIRKPSLERLKNDR